MLLFIDVFVGVKNLQFVKKHAKLKIFETLF